MTLKEIEQCTKDILIPTDVAECLGCDPHAIRVQAHEDASLLGFPVTIIGTRIKIPREAFIKHMKGLTTPTHEALL